MFPHAKIYRPKCWSVFNPLPGAWGLCSLPLRTVLGRATITIRQGKLMARIRTTKPEFWSSEQVVECSPNARLLFLGMLNFCDDNGIHPASPGRLKMEVFPGDSFTRKDVTGWIEELIAVGLVIQYSVESQSYWRVTGFVKHQKIDNPSRRYPTEDEASPRGGLREGYPPEGKGMEGNGRDNTTPSAEGVMPQNGPNGIKPPNETHKPVHWLCYGFALKRRELYGDKHFNWWDPKYLGQSKHIIEKKAGGDYQEVLRRTGILYQWSQTDQYYQFTLGDLESKWEKLVLPPNARLNDESTAFLASLEGRATY